MRRKSSKIPFTCQRCTKVFFLYPKNRTENNRFCSWTCRYSATAAERFWQKVQKTETCWLWQGTSSQSGYGLFSPRAGKTVSAHRFSWQLSFGEAPDSLCVCHHCDVKLCVRPDHLFLGTASDNVWDHINKGLRRNGNPKITESMVRAIRMRYAAGDVLQSELAAEFGIGRAQVGKIVRLEQWSHIR